MTDEQIIVSMIMTVFVLIVVLVDHYRKHTFFEKNRQMLERRLEVTKITSISEFEAAASKSDDTAVTIIEADYFEEDTDVEKLEEQAKQLKSEDDMTFEELRDEVLGEVRVYGLAYRFFAVFDEGTQALLTELGSDAGTNKDRLDRRKSRFSIVTNVLKDYGIVEYRGNDLHRSRQTLQYFHYLEQKRRLDKYKEEALLKTRLKIREGVR